MNTIEMISEIERLKKEKNAIILGHFYQRPEIQDISDFIGDSLALAQKALNVDADIIIFAGVKFMAETAKLINPSKKVILPDFNAGCSLADSCPADAFQEFIKHFPDHLVVSYINTTNEIKALSDVIVTSSNALQIVNSFPIDQKLIFGPDKNLGDYINKLSGRNMVVWPGACHVHKQFSLERIIALKNTYPDSKLIAHPECEKEVLLVSDYIGSTTALLNFTKSDPSNIYIVATETGILHQMKKFNPYKNFIAAPPDDSTCACNDCSFMKLITIEKIYHSLLMEEPEIKLGQNAERALLPIQRMLDLSNTLGL